MVDRKIVINEYKQRKSLGGVFKVTNTATGKFYLDCAPNLQAKHNSFDFMVSSGTCFNHKLREDWATFGPKVFVFEIIEELKPKEEQISSDYLEELKNLKQMWQENIGTVNQY